MDLNPYESPTPAAAQRLTLSIVVLRILAFACCLGSLFLIVGFLLILNRPEVVERHASNLALALSVDLVALILPAVGLALLGVASWRRSGRLALIGIATAVLPFIVFVLAVMLLRQQQ